MRRILFLSVLCSAACRPDFATVDEACDDRVPGSKKVTNDEAIEVFRRMGCYRRLARMGRAKMNPLIQEAVTNHNLYQQKNYLPEDWPTKLGEEESGKPGFTGEDAYARLEAVGYTGGERGALGLWEYVYWDDEDPVSRVDFWFHDPEARQAVLQPSWVAGGYAEGPLQNAGPEHPPKMAYMALFYQIPVREHAGSPVIYPKDGQEEVPTGFEAVDPNQVMYGQGMLGYPITLTVGSIEHGGDPNPHGIKIRASKLTGPGGEVSMTAFDPVSDPQMRYSAAFYPDEELQPNSEYTFEVTLDWGTQENRTFTSTFRTGRQWAPHSYRDLAREVPPRPQIRHRVIDLPPDPAPR